MAQPHPFPGEKRFRGCIFDFDGVLVDTERYHFQAWNRSAAGIGGMLSWEEYLPLKSTGTATITGAIAAKAGLTLTPELQQRLAQEKAAVFADAAKALSCADIIPGVPELLAQLTALGIPPAIASSSAASAQLARELGLAGWFTVIVDGSSGLPRKPQPDLFLAAAQGLGLPPADCLVFEDSLAGIRAAQAAGMAAIAVGGIRSDYASVHIQDFRDPAPWFDRFFQQPKQCSRI